MEHQKQCVNFWTQFISILIIITVTMPHGRFSEDFSQTESHGPHTGTGQHGPDEANKSGYFLFLERTGETSDDFSSSDPRIRTPYYQVCMFMIYLLSNIYHQFSLHIFSSSFNVDESDDMDGTYWIYNEIYSKENKTPM